MTTVLIVVALLLTAVGSRWLFLQWAKHEAHEMVEHFARAFPDRCLICAYHRYGLQEGLVRPGSPVPEHHCKEPQR